MSKKSKIQTNTKHEKGEVEKIPASDLLLRHIEKLENEFMKKINSAALDEAEMRDIDTSVYEFDIESMSWVYKREG
jgi:hypothetical protein